MKKKNDVAGARLRSFVERIERLEEEKTAIQDDIKEVKKMGKGLKRRLSWIGRDTRFTHSQLSMTKQQLKTWKRLQRSKTNG